MHQKVCDDIGIIKHFMRKGKRYGFRNLSKDVSCKMYDDGKEAFRGIERSLTDIFPSTFIVVLSLILAVITLFLLAWTPLLYPLFFSFGNMMTYLYAISGWILTFLSWAICASSLGFWVSVSFSSFISLTAICAMYVHGMYRKITGKGFDWKGRQV